MSRARRVLVVTWPDWPVVAAGCPVGVPAVVVAANRVVAVTPAARAEGVEKGLRRRDAQGRCPGLEVVPADAGRDARTWEPVVAAVEQLTTGVEVLEPGSLGFATRGPSRYFGGDRALALKVREVVQTAGAGIGPAVDGAVNGAVDTGEGCRIGVADGLFTAGLAARVAPPAGLIIPPGESRKWLSPLPVTALGPAYGDLTDLLLRLGIRTLGDLASLPGRAVLGRFGPEGEAARRLALGRESRGLEGREPPPDLSCSAEMDPPELRIEAAAFVAKSLADELHRRLDQAGLVTTMVAIEVETEHGENLIRHWRHEGALSAAALAERTRWQLEGWLSGSAGRGAGAGVTDGSGAGAGAPTGGITLLRLTPLEVRPDAGRQLGFWGGTADSDARAARSMARVQGLLGPEAVVTAVMEGGRGLADQVRLVPWGDAADPTRRRPAGAKEAADRPTPWPGRLARPSPAIVLDPPRTADLCDAEGRPVEVSGRGLLSSEPAALAVENGAFERIVAWAGPWPLEERWWEAGRRRRARMQVVVEGGEAYVVSRETGCWRVEASYG
jgi:protein ImuB